MALHVYNTLTRKKETFEPMDGTKVKMFVCGPTVYDLSHIGHARSYISFDVIAKYLRWKKFDVFYLQNITDIDDKIIVRGNEAGKDPLKLAKEYENIYYEDMTALGVNSVSKYAAATDYIPQIISQVERLIEKGHAYEAADGIYFDITTFPDYGKLSKQNLEELKVSRIEENPVKRNQGDFVLWKKEKPGEPTWDSPWGKGRPGWHIEDTAITETEFGPQYDLHGGGMDLIFPHHEAEITQMEACSGKVPFVKYWVHNGFLQVEGEKMSKSLNNFTTIRDALANHDKRALRYFFLSTHYRAPINYAEQSLEAAKNTVERLDEFVRVLRSITEGEDNPDVPTRIEKLMTDFEVAMDDDFEISKALAGLFDFVKDINIIIADQKLSKANADAAIAAVEEVNDVLGVVSFEEEALSAELKKLIEEREEARKNKDFEAADRIRDELKSKGIIIDDTAQGVRWKKA